MEDVIPKAAPTAVPEDDSLLLARARQGDERAFSQIYRRHAGSGLDLRVLLE